MIFVLLSSLLSINKNPSCDLSPRAVSNDTAVAKLALAVDKSIFLNLSPSSRVSFSNLMD